MLAALLCNEPYSGGAPDREREKRLVAAMRQEHFDRQEHQGAETVATIEAKAVFKIPVLPEIKELKLPSGTATLGNSSEDDELALLFIIAEL
tara:strand:+ start:37 stop:312 length:276 start_codon:yes stop_codon:yes gene_type:complete